MGVTGESITEARSWNRKQWTTIVLEERSDGRWLATQRGVSVEGRGETAAAAATAYCEKIDGGNG